MYVIALTLSRHLEKRQSESEKELKATERKLNNALKDEREIKEAMEHLDEEKITLKKISYPIFFSPKKISNQIYF